MAHGQQRDLVVEVDEALDDHAARRRRGRRSARSPRPRRCRRRVRTRLWPLPEDDITGLTTHGRPIVGDRGAVVLERVDEAVGRGRQAERFRGEAADAFAIHRQARGARGRDHPRVCVPRSANSCSSSTSVCVWIASISGHDQVRPLARDQRAHGVAVEHVQHVAAMRDLHRRRVGVAVGGDHFHAEALQFDARLPCPVRPNRAAARAWRAGTSGVPSVTMRDPYRDGDAVGFRRKSHRQGYGRGTRRAAILARMPSPRPPCLRRHAGHAAALALCAVAASEPAAARATSTGGRAARSADWARSAAWPPRAAIATCCGCTTTAATRRTPVRGRRPTATGWRRCAIEGVTKTDWEDIAAFELDGSDYLLIADTGDNGGLRRTLQLHVVEEPARLRRTHALRPAWSIAFRWPDGARDCEAVAVDAAARPGPADLEEARSRRNCSRCRCARTGTALQTAPRASARLAGVPQPDAEDPRAQPAARARSRAQVTAADVSPDGRTLAVLTYRYLLLYPRGARRVAGRRPCRARPRSGCCPGCPRPRPWAGRPTAAACTPRASSVPAPAGTRIRARRPDQRDRHSSPHPLADMISF